ncbi:HpcH/HpaI aldolase/citrate lyase family protein [Amycolatopsis benzoatilytica]|uniref:HpcH/HpaI aldolase/citrate lyase family protein n=1 Tax=Amycolatopsis benzoatilytica TaxID=346045 RepID=UPI000366C64B|nr:CoA ester lyase [Amycolatopsis benzoatilytica]
MTPVLTLLYVPADRPDRVAKALASEADVVLVDLEDAVAPARKDAARENAVRLLAEVPPARLVQVRINHLDTPWHAADVAAVAALPSGVGVRLPKVESPVDIQLHADALPGRELHPLIESALGVERALTIALASPRIASLGLGEADLRSDLRLADETGLTWARSRVVNAARAARLPPPAMSVYANVRDLDGLAQSCRTGRALGFRGRTAIHPGQLATIREAFLPTEAEVAQARAVLSKMDGATQAGVGAIALADGTFVDVAMLDQARAVLSLVAE